MQTKTPEQEHTEHFPQKKLRNAELIIPPNRLREKVGYGGIDATVLIRAQELLESNSQDFVPIAEMYMELMEETVQDIRTGNKRGEDAIEALIYPVMQLKSQGSMFQYPLITDVSSILISFLESIRILDTDALDIVNAHKMTMKAILSSHIQGKGGDQGQALIGALKDACVRYFNTHNIS